ncbi:STAS domain-containing protein [Actinocrinis puniceicyclus]|uniref:STAS domain-containing protein n=1 Tax=Actinocrinis puniceicyclus TaxID=977794 RepID=A0A8J8BB30_9ACTN|nr:STAS domain-containing protein [Actinocrinis puniceicyclus]MBS2961671.1 STAS domain-containing protein [Actinocrinis puniceicyclus]
MPLDPPASADSGPFDCRVVRDDTAAAVLAACGEIDLSTRDRLLAALTSLFSDRRPLLLDLSQVTFIDCSALRVLQTVHRAHDRFAVVAPSPPVQRLLHLAGARVTVYEGPDAALRALATDRPP